MEIMKKRERAKIEGKTITSIYADGYDVRIFLDDGTEFIYRSRNDGYSRYEIREREN